MSGDRSPKAIVAFLEAEDYEDAIRNAISLGGDADRLAAITGGIAHAYFGEVPEELAEVALASFPEGRAVWGGFRERYGVPV